MSGIDAYRTRRHVEETSTHSDGDAHRAPTHKEGQMIMIGTTTARPTWDIRPGARRQS